MKTHLFKERRFLIVHFRVGKSDGVSLEIAAWKKILTEQGAIVALCAGPESLGADYIIPDLEYQLDPEIFQIDIDAFGGLKQFKSKRQLVNAIKVKQNTLEVDFAKVVADFQPTNIIISNIFAVGVGIHAAGALTRVLDRIRIPTTLVNHDFYWENNRRRDPSCQFVARQLENFFPLKRDYVRNYCINSIGQQALLEKKGIESDILFDTFDYQQAGWKRQLKTTRYLKGKGVPANALVVLQATRVIRRKNIEISIDFTRELIARREALTGALYDGRYFNAAKDPVVLIISGYVEKSDEAYLTDLLAYGCKSGVPVVYLGGDLHKEYELFDIYPYADIITYPSAYEGFGNQLLEAFFARKPVLLFEYPVYKSDLKAKNFDLLTLGDEKLVDPGSGFASIEPITMSRAVTDAIELLKDRTAYGSKCALNFEIAARNFSHENTLETFRAAFA